MIINYFYVAFLIVNIIAVHHSYTMIKSLTNRNTFTISETKQFIGEEKNDYYGLLDSIKDITTAQYFSNNINMDRAYNLITNKKFIYNAAIKDAKTKGVDISDYLKSAVKNSKNFIKSETLWNREDLAKTIQDIVEDFGKFICFLGGKSVGKSFLLNDIEKKFPKKVYYINMRSERTILSGLLKSLRKKFESDELFFDQLKKFYNYVKYSFEASIEVVKVTAKTTSSVDYAPLTLENVIEGIIIENKEPITIIIDEANMVFNREDADSIKSSRETLAFFVHLTKEQNKINVILVSSENTFPFQLKKIGMNIEDIEDSIIAGELAPKDIYKLLTEIWKLGPELSNALIACYGGHIFSIYKALQKLSVKKSNFIGPVTPLQISKIEQCISDCNVDEIMENTVLDIFERLAVSGFCPSAKSAKRYDDKVEQIISLNNVGAVVLANSYIQGVPSDIWESFKVTTGIVPSDQAMRLAIIQFLWEWRNEIKED